MVSLSTWHKLESAEKKVSVSLLGWPVSMYVEHCLEFIDKGKSQPLVGSTIL